jgi:hypothetical protein
MNKYFVAKGCKFSFYALKFIIVSNCNRVPSSRSNLDLTKAKYSISRLSVVEKENVRVRINPNTIFLLRVRKENDDENEDHNQHVHLEP